MGQRFKASKTKGKSFDIGRKTTDFSGFKRGRLGTTKNPATVVVQTWEKRDELKKIFDENGWSCRIKVKPEMEEDIRELESLQKVGKTQVSEENTGRNDPCACGSGKKYKKCCLGK